MEQVMIKPISGDTENAGGVVDTSATGIDWTKLPTPGALKTEGFLEQLSNLFSENVVIKKKALDEAMKKVGEDASDPEALAKYQAALGEYTLYRNAQSNAVKAYKDVDANTIRNFN
jgi:type III secretion protein F